MARPPADKLTTPPLSVTRAQWNAWLAKHHATRDEVLVLITKKGGAPPVIGANEAVEVALVWGWIDSQKWSWDERAAAQRFSPRRARSPWSKINRARAEALIASGAMKPPGLAEVERAKADGRWDAAYDSARTATVPPDLAAALAASRRAKTAFEALDGANRYAILWRVQTAKLAKTRADRIARFVAMLERGETVHPRPEKAAASKPATPRAKSSRRSPA